MICINYSFNVGDLPIKNIAGKWNLIQYQFSKYKQSVPTNPKIISAGMNGLVLMMATWRVGEIHRRSHPIPQLILELSKQHLQKFIYKKAHNRFSSHN